MKNRIEERIKQLQKEMDALGYEKAKKKEKSFANTYFRDLNREEQFLFIQLLFEKQSHLLFSIATLWIKEHKEFIDISYFPIYEKWLYQYIVDWGRCDQYCYRVLNPMIEAYPDLFDKALEWSCASETYVKRASAVCLIHSSITFEVNVPFSFVKQICEQLKNDEHLHIRKGIG